MRGYLLFSLVLSIVLPLVSIPTKLANGLIGRNLDATAIPVDIINPYTLAASDSLRMDYFSNPNASLLAISLGLLTATYLIGALFKSLMFFLNVRKIAISIKSNLRHRDGKYWFINTEADIPAYSFFNYIFINTKFRGLSNDDITKIRNHEIIHARQLHTLDIVFTELLSIVFWFSPLLQYAKRQLKEIHEFIADDETAGQGEMKRNYAQLLFNLATENKFPGLMTGFSGKQITKRITMVTKAKSLDRTKVLFLLLLPISLLLLISFSSPDKTVHTTSYGQNATITDGPNYAKVRNVKWVNNTIFSAAELNEALDLKKGDKYVRENMKPKFNIYTDKIIRLYSAKHYFFSRASISETPVNDEEVDLTVTMSEGKQGKIGTIQITGNKTVSTEEIESKLTVKPGELFNFIKIMESMHAIGTIRKLDSEKVVPLIAPQKYDPKDEYITVNVGFQVTEKL